METKRRTAYCGTNGCPGHYFSAISGEFSPQEEEELSKIDEDFQLFGFSGFNFFYYKGYGCLSFSASPHVHLTCRKVGEKTGFFYLSGYDDTLHSVWNSDYLIDCAQETLLTIITLL